MRSHKKNPILWLSLPLLVLFGLMHFLPAVSVCDWVIVYYMSYDNDLSPYSRVILHDLEKGVISSGIAVTVQADFADSRGMKRIVLYHADGKVRLLFLQQCGRAAIQNIYSFADCAEYIMASPLRVGAPNTYYAATLASVAEDPNVTGKTIAETIMREDEHYTVYTLIDNDRLRDLPEKLKPVLGSFEVATALNQPKACLPVFEFADEKFYDLKSYLFALSSVNSNIANKELGDFFSWCENSFIVKKAFRGPDSKNSSNCGLSIYAPSSGAPNYSYDFLLLYQETNLGAIFRRSTK